MRIFGDGLDRDPANLPQRRPAQHGARAAEEAGIPKIIPILHKAVELVTMEDSERRSVILVNPGLAPKRATVTTMYTAYRLNDANEIMPPHKHSPSAVRLGPARRTTSPGPACESTPVRSGVVRRDRREPDPRA